MPTYGEINNNEVSHRYLVNKTSYKRTWTFKHH